MQLKSLLFILAKFSKFPLTGCVTCVISIVYKCTYLVQERVVCTADLQLHTTQY